jgi:hypothetical protein
MPYNPTIHHRRCRGGFETRPYGYDYSQAGLYFKTLCGQNRQCVFGEIDNFANWEKDKFYFNETGQ